MACPNIHLAIMKRYMEKNNIDINAKEALAGTLYPDAAEDNDKSHYTNKFRGLDNISHVRGKVNLYAFLQEHTIEDAFQLGWFLHLVTDYLFFEECFSIEYLLQTSYSDFCKDLYFAYNCLNLYIEEKYNITRDDFESYPNEYYSGIPYEECILDKDRIDTFIDRVSSIALEEYVEKIKVVQKNAKP